MATKLICMLLFVTSKSLCKIHLAIGWKHTAAKEAACLLYALGSTADPKESDWCSRRRRRLLCCDGSDKGESGMKNEAGQHAEQPVCLAARFVPSLESLPDLVAGARMTFETSLLFNLDCSAPAYVITHTRVRTYACTRSAVHLNTPREQEEKGETPLTNRVCTEAQAHACTWSFFSQRGAKLIPSTPHRLYLHGFDVRLRLSGEQNDSFTL